MPLPWIDEETYKQNGINTAIKNKERFLANYEKNPKFCKKCNLKLDYIKRHNSFCNHKCAAEFNNKGRIVSEEQKQKISESLEKRYTSSKKKSKYDWNLLQQEYDSGLTLKGIHEKFGISISTLKKGVKRGVFKTRSYSEALKLSFKIHGNKFGTSEQISKNRYKQLAVEEALAENLRKEGFEVFSPTVVCDRIAIKDGQLYFVDFKPDGQDLRPIQDKVRNTTKDKYKVVHYNKEDFKDIEPLVPKRLKN